ARPRGRPHGPSHAVCRDGARVEGRSRRVRGRRDPWGQKHEHYADGDLFDASQPAGYHLMDRAGLYQWGPDLPNDFVDARLTPRRVWNLLRRAMKDRDHLKTMMGLKAAMS